MGEDVLVVQARDIRARCTQCGGRKFRVTLEADTYIVDLKRGYSEPTRDTCYRDIIEMVCSGCGRKVRI